jgi:hypothetical protein
VEGTREKKRMGPEPVRQEGIGSLLLLAAAQQTGFLVSTPAIIHRRRYTIYVVMGTRPCSPSM